MMPLRSRTRARGDVIARQQPGRLAGQAVVVLLVERVGDDAGALLARLVLLQPLREAAPKREGLGGGIAGGGEAAIAGPVERRDIGGAQIVERLIERIGVDIAVGGVGADVPEVGIPRKRHAARGLMLNAEIQRWRAVPGNVRHAIHTAVIVLQKAEVLKSIPGEPIVRIRET